MNNFLTNINNFLTNMNNFITNMNNFLTKTFYNGVQYKKNFNNNKL